MSRIEVKIEDPAGFEECEIVEISVKPGDTVAEGDVLLVMESMKMELSITAPHPGTVAGLDLAPGDRVALKQPLVAVVERKEGQAS